MTMESHLDDESHEEKEIEEGDMNINVDTSTNEPEEPAFNIHEEREKCVCGLWVAFFVTLVSGVIATTIYVSEVFFFIRDPEPTFTTTSILEGYRYDFFHEAKTFNESQRICTTRKSNLIVFNNTEEHSRFNDYVLENFEPYIRNRTEQWKRRGLQIWTGIRILFKANKQTQFDWPDRMESPMSMMKFYAISQEARLCHVATMERMRQYRKAMQSKDGSKQFIVKDFTGKFENNINETGCWQVRILEDNETLLLPFVCKSSTGEKTTENSSDPVEV